MLQLLFAVSFHTFVGKFNQFHMNGLLNLAVFLTLVVVFLFDLSAMHMLQIFQNPGEESSFKTKAVGTLFIVHGPKTRTISNTLEK